MVSRGPDGSWDDPLLDEEEDPSPPEAFGSTWPASVALLVLLLLVGLLVLRGLR